jgi:hypothetical protein
MESFCIKIVAAKFRYIYVFYSADPTENRVSDKQNAREIIFS